MKSPKVIVIALDANTHDPEAEIFNFYPVSVKLAMIENHIIGICEQLKVIAPHSLWLITWCETAIQHDVDKLALSPDEKKEFKETFKRLTERYSNLAIVAGTIQTYKNTTDPNKVEQVLECYNLIKHMEQEEILDSVTFIKEERRRVLRARKNYTDFTVLRNSCFVFYRKTIWCHDKTAPVKETLCNDHLHHLIYQPPKEKRANPICKLIHPTTLEEIKIGIEICGEHSFGYVKNVAEQEPIFLHLILSATIALKHDYLAGKYTIQLDTEKKPVLILDQNENVRKLPIQYYQSSLFNYDDPLVGPLKPVYPFVKRMLNKLDAAIEKLPPSNNQKGLKALRKHIVSNLFLSVLQDNKEALTFLEEQLHLHRYFFVSPCNTNSFFKYPNLEQLLDELKNLVQKQKRENPFFSDIHPRDDAPLLKP